MYPLLEMKQSTKMRHTLIAIEYFSAGDALGILQLSILNDKLKQVKINLTRFIVWKHTKEG